MRLKFLLVVNTFNHQTFIQLFSSFQNNKIRQVNGEEREVNLKTLQLVINPLQLSSLQFQDYLCIQNFFIRN